MVVRLRAFLVCVFSGGILSHNVRVSSNRTPYLCLMWRSHDLKMVGKAKSSYGLRRRLVDSKTFLPYTANPLFLLVKTPAVYGYTAVIVYLRIVDIIYNKVI